MLNKAISINAGRFNPQPRFGFSDSQKRELDELDAQILARIEPRVMKAHQAEEMDVFELIRALKPEPQAVDSEDIASKKHIGAIAKWLVHNSWIETVLSDKILKLLPKTNSPETMQELQAKVGLLQDDLKRHYSNQPVPQEVFGALTTVKKIAYGLEPFPKDGKVRLSFFPASFLKETPPTSGQNTKKERDGSEIPGF